MPAIPVTPDPSPSGMRARLWVGLAVVVVAMVGIVVGVALVSEREQPTRQETVAERGADVMPFDLEATTHEFAPTERGGVQTLVADDPADGEQIALIRGHLRAEVARFRVGDFGDPAAIHGHDMPGLAVLESNAARLEISYRDLDDGAEVTYRSADPAVVAALHDWFAAQLADHGTHAQTG